MKYNLLALLLIASTFQIFAQSEQAQDREVYVHIDIEYPLWTISKYLTGLHFVYGTESNELYKDNRIAKWMKDSKVGTIRYPGGTVVMTYHWDSLNGINFKVDSWDPEYNEISRDPADYMDVDEYIAYCRKVNADPMLGVNILSGRKYKSEDDGLDEAKRLIQHCKDKNYQVKFWYIGNEGYAKGFSPLEYAKTIDKYAKVLKSVEPDIVIIGDWKLGPIWKDRFNQCIEIVKNSEHIDVMEVHDKWSVKWGLKTGTTREDWENEFPLYNGRFGMYIQRFHYEMERIGKPHVKIGFNEWGVGCTGGSKSECAMIAADYLLELFRNDVFMACDWNLNMGAKNAKILETENNQLVRLNPTADIWEMYASAMGKKLVRVDCSDKEVYGFAAFDEKSKTVQLYLMNKSEEESKLEISGLMSAYKISSKETFDISGNRKIEEVSSEENNISLHPWTFNKIVFKF